MTRSDSAALQAALHAAVVHHEAGRLAEADLLYREILRSVPDHQDALYFSGVLAQQTGRMNAAAQLIMQAIEVDPSNASSAMFCNLGTLLQAQGSLTFAVTCFQRALTIDPDSAEACNSLGNAYHALGKLDAAIACYHKAIGCDPQYVEAMGNLGNTLRLQGRSEEAADCYRKAIAIRPNHAVTHSLLGNLLQAQGNVTAAIECHHRALAIDPDFAVAHLNDGLCHLLNGDFERGLEQYEWRFKASPRIRHDFGLPLWRGESLAGRSILLTAEQGFGDTLQFVRYVSVIAQQAERVVLLVQPPLQRLLSSIPGVDTVLSEGDELPPCDFSCPLLSLPYRCATRLHTIPAHVPYVQSDVRQIEVWKARLAEDNAGTDLRVGLVWSGNARTELGDFDLTCMDARRSIRLAQLAPLWSVEHVRFYSLQLDEPAQQAASVPMPLIDHTHQLQDFSDTAALISNLDLVISVDTSVAHLAGALGKPVWLLNRFDTCWRWQLARSDSPWYPTMHIFRQEKAGSWEALVDELAQKLRSWVYSAPR